MASHVFVVDSRARKARIATTPATHMSDILQQGCRKLGLDSALFILKHNNKAVDLSRPFRQANLPGGAQLQLVQGSRSPTVITVAIQIPHLEGSRRVTEKFPSSHSVWQILRFVETKEKLNFTQRASAEFSDTSSGRLHYEMPVVNVANRELNCFADLQKTLSQLGITSGNVLLRLNFKVTEQPFEEAISDITQFFKEESTVSEDTPETPVVSSETKQENVDPSQPTSSSSEALLRDTQSATEATTLGDAKVPVNHEVIMEGNANPDTSTSGKPVVTVYHAPTTSAISRVVHNEADYVPTMEHATIHQSRLSQYSRNKRLPSDAEIAAKEQEKEAKLALVTNVEVRVRFPDQTQIKADFQRGSSAQDVYGIVRSQLQKPDLKFFLRYVDSKGAHVVLPDDAKLDILAKVGWGGRQLVNMEWDTAIPPGTREGPVLASEVLKQAQNLPVPAEPKDPNQADEKIGKFLGGLFKKDENKQNLSSGEKEDKLKKFLGFGKKK